MVVVGRAPRREPRGVLLALDLGGAGLAADPVLVRRADVGERPRDRPAAGEVQRAVEEVQVTLLHRHPAPQRRVDRPHHLALRVDHRAAEGGLVQFAAVDGCGVVDRELQRRHGGLALPDGHVGVVTGPVAPAVGAVLLRQLGEERPLRGVRHVLVVAGAGLSAVRGALRLPPRHPRLAVGVAAGGLLAGREVDAGGRADAVLAGHRLQVLQRLLALRDPGLVAVVLVHLGAVEERVARVPERVAQIDRAEVLAVVVGLDATGDVHRTRAGVDAVRGDLVVHQQRGGRDQLEGRARGVLPGGGAVEQRDTGRRAGQLAVVGLGDAPDELLRVVGGIARGRENPARLRIHDHDRARRRRVTRVVGIADLPGQRGLRERLQPGVDAGHQGVALLRRGRPARSDGVALRVELNDVLAVDAAERGVVLLLQPGGADGVDVVQRRVGLLVGRGDLAGVAEHVRGQRAVGVLRSADRPYRHPGNCSRCSLMASTTPVEASSATVTGA